MTALTSKEEYIFIEDANDKHGNRAFPPYIIKGKLKIDNFLIEKTKDPTDEALKAFTSIEITEPREF